MIAASTKRDWAYRMATKRQGQSATPRCESPGKADVDIAEFWLDLALATVPSIPVQGETQQNSSADARRAAGDGPIVRTPEPGQGRAGSPAQWSSDEQTKAAARAHYEHHYGPASFDLLAEKTVKRLVYRMRAALLSLHPPPADERVRGLVEALTAASETLAASCHLLRKYVPDHHHWRKEHNKRIDGIKNALAPYRASDRQGGA